VDDPRRLEVLLDAAVAATGLEEFVGLLP